MDRTSVTVTILNKTTNYFKMKGKNTMKNENKEIIPVTFVGADLDPDILALRNTLDELKGRDDVKVREDGTLIYKDENSIKGILSDSTPVSYSKPLIDCHTCLRHSDMKQLLSSEMESMEAFAIKWIKQYHCFMLELLNRKWDSEGDDRDLYMSKINMNKTDNLEALNASLRDSGICL